MKILITGIAGFIGSRFADWVLDNHPEVEVIGVDNFSGGTLDNLDPRLTQVWNIDLSKESALMSGLQILDVGQIDYVFHFAAFAAEGLSPFLRRRTYMDNIIATSSVVNYCVNKGVKRLVYTSSAAVYGVGGPACREDDEPVPVDPYGIAKYACELDIQAAGMQFGMDWCILRPHSVFGAKQKLSDPYRNVLAIWTDRVKRGKPITVYGDGKQVRSFSVIDNILPCFWQAAVSEKASKQIINVGSENYCSVLEAANTFLRITGPDIQNTHIKFLEPRLEPREVVPTSKKAKELLGYEETISFEEGLKQMWEWAKGVSSSTVTYLKPEITKGIYGFWKK